MVARHLFLFILFQDGRGIWKTQKAGYGMLYLKKVVIKPDQPKVDNGGLTPFSNVA